jgi:acetone carboxylase gamma subunit
MDSQEMKEIRIGESLKIVRQNAKWVVNCRECGKVICNGSENYKMHVPYIDRDPHEIGHKMVKSEWITYREYYCPQCATLLTVVQWRPGDPEYQDTILDLGGM